MALISLTAQIARENEVHTSLLDGAKSKHHGARGGISVAARQVLSAPYLASVVLRVASGLAVGFWLVQVVKMNIG